MAEKDQSQQSQNPADTNPATAAVLELVEILRKKEKEADARTAEDKGSVLEQLVAKKAGCAVSDLPKGTRMNDARVILSPRYWVLIFDRLNIGEIDLLLLGGECDSV